MTINDYALVSDVKTQLPDTQWDTTYDALITGLITSASREIDRWANKLPGAFYVTTPSVQFFRGPTPTGSTAAGSWGWYSPDRLPVGYLSTLSLWSGEMAAPPISVAIAETGQLTNYTTLATTDYILWPYNAPAYGEPYQRLDLDLLNGATRTWYGFPKGVQINGYFGYSQIVPADVKQAVLITVVRLFKRAQMNWQDLSVGLDPTQKVYQNKIDSDVQMLLMHYRGLVI